jgi:hypothetical protein
MLLQFPPTAREHEALEQLAAEASTVPAVMKKLPVVVALPPKVRVAELLFTATFEKRVPEVVVAVALVLPENVVVAEGVKVPAVCQKSPVIVRAVEVLNDPEPEIMRLL